MSYESFIALRYLKGKRSSSFVSVITLISILGITVGVTALIIVLSVMAGFQEDLRDKILGINAHLIVMEFGGPLNEHEALTEKLKELDDVTGVTPFVYSQAMLSSEDGMTGVVVRGVELSTLGDVTILPERMQEGSLDGLKKSFKQAAAEGELPGIVIGRELATTLGVTLYEEIRVVSPSGTGMGGTPRMAAFMVSGIFEVGMYEYDSAMAFISIENAQSFFKLGKAVTGMELKIKDVYKAAEVKQAIMDTISGPYWARTWMEMNKNLFSALKLEKAAMFIILTLIIIVAALNIISTLIMVVMEKGKEIAILKSIGATSGGIMKIFIIEGVIIGVVGTLLGTAMGLLGALNLESIVALVETTFNFKVLPPSIYYIDKLPSKVEPMAIAFIVFISLSISFLATIYPSWKASRLTPVEGLRYE